MAGAVRRLDAPANTAMAYPVGMRRLHPRFGPLLGVAKEKKGRHVGMTAWCGLLQIPFPWGSERRLLRDRGIRVALPWSGGHCYVTAQEDLAISIRPRTAADSEHRKRLSNT